MTAELFGAFTPHTIRQERRDGTVKFRDILVPDEATTEQHEAMLRRLYGLDIPMPYATACQPGATLLDNVRPHRQNDFFFLADIKDAFASVDIPTLLEFARTPVIPKRFQQEVTEFIEFWATAPQVPGLPLGAPCSPFLFNLYCLQMDRQLGEYCDKQGITYTRYLDDLTFSSAAAIGKKRRRRLSSLVEAMPGMVINDNKTRVHRLANGPVTITGVSLQPDRRLQPSPQLLETARQVFADAEALGQDGVELTDREVGVLHGWHGVLEQLYEGETPTSRSLHTHYRRALGLQGLLQAIDGTV